MKDFIARHDTSTTNIKLFLQPYSAGYLYSNFENGQQAGGRIEYVRLFSVVAVFILVIAWPLAWLAMHTTGCIISLTAFPSVGRYLP